jgi:hypothetical protein
MSCLASPRGVCFCMSVLIGFSVVFGHTAAGAGNIPTKYPGVWSSTDCQLPKSATDIGELHVTRPYQLVSCSR